MVDRNKDDPRITNYETKQNSFSGWSQERADLGPSNSVSK